MTTVHTSQPKWRPSDPEQEPKNPELYSEQKAWDELQYKSWSGTIFNGQDTGMPHLPEQSK